MNKQIEELYNKLDAQDKIINEQVLEIARLKEKIDKAREYLKKREEDNMCCSVCSVMSDDLLEILGDEENE